MRIPTSNQLLDAILEIRSDQLIAEHFGSGWYRRGDPRDLLPLTFEEFHAAALERGIPDTILVERVGTGHEHYVITKKDGQFHAGFAERGQIDFEHTCTTIAEARERVLRELWALYQSTSNPENWVGGVPAGTPYPSGIKIHYAPSFRSLSLFGVFVFWGMAYLGWRAYLDEGLQTGSALAVLFIVIGGLWLAALAAAPQSIHFGSKSLSLRRWLGTQVIPYDAITGISQSYATIAIKTIFKTVRLFKLYANHDALLMNALEQYVPAAIAQRKHRMKTDFPISLVGKKSTPVFTFMLGLTLLSVGVGTAWYSPGGGDQAPGLQLILGLFIAILGCFFLYLVLWHYPRRTTFSRDEMVQQYFLRRTTQPMRGIIDFQPGHTLRNLRGVDRRLYHITFHYQDGATFRWTPGDADFPIDYLDAYASAQMLEMTERLRKAYQTPGSPGPLQA